MEEGTAVALLDATASASGFSQASLGLRSLIPEGSEESFEPFGFALGYVLVERSSARRERSEGPFGSMFASGEWRFPPRLESLDDAVLSAWADALQDLKVDAVWAARLGDLLWVKKFKPAPHQMARTAFEAYSLLSHRAGWHAVERARCATRALEIATELRDPQLVEGGCQLVDDLVLEDLTSEGGGPGVTLMLLDALFELPKQPDQPLLEQRAVAALERYGDDPHIESSLVSLRARVSPEQAKGLREQEILRWRKEAARAEGFLRVTWLEKALDFARQHGFASLADEIRLELQGLSPDTFDLKTIATEVSIPAAELEAYVRGIVGDDDLNSALTRVGLQPPPGGSAARLVEEVEELREVAPLQFLMTQVLIGPDSATAIFRADTDEKHLRLALGRQRQQHAAFAGVVLADALQAIGDRYRPDEEYKLVGLLSTPVIDQQTAERVARALQLFWDGHYDDSATILVPRIEAVLRTLARACGVPVVREPGLQSDIGGVSTLGLLLTDLEPAFHDADWLVYLRDLLVNPLSLNLRNSICHGLRSRVHKSDAALLLHAALFLRLLDTKSSAPAEQL